LLLALTAILAITAVGLVLWPPTPRLIVENTSLAFQYPGSSGWILVVLSIGLGLCAVLFPQDKKVRLAAAIAALASLLGGVERLVFSVEAGDKALSLRGLLGKTEVRWQDVTRVYPEESALVLRRSDGGTVRVPTTSFTEDQVGALERRVASRVKETHDGGLR
jgi:hypothetical protein